MSLLINTPSRATSTVMDNDSAVYALDSFGTVVRLNTATGSTVLNRRAVTNASYAVQDTDYYIAMKGLTASRTITLPSGQDAGFTIVVKDADGLSGTYNIILDVEGSDTIDGSTTVTLSTNYISLTLVYDGVSNYEII